MKHLHFNPSVVLAGLVLLGARTARAADGPPESPALQALEKTLPAGGRLYWVDQNHAAASDDGQGDKSHPFKTISPAAKLAKAGDTVLVRAGTYRERVAPAVGGEEGKPVIYMAAPGERVVVKGSEVWTPALQPFRDQAHVFKAKLDDSMFAAGRNPYRRRISIADHDPLADARPHKGPWLPHTLGQLFLDGEAIAEADSVDMVTASPNSWIVSPEGGSIIVHLPHHVAGLAGHTLELTVRDRIFAPMRRGLGFIHVKGFVFEHCANQGQFPQAGAFSPRSGHHWLIEGNVIRWAKTIGLDCGSEFWDPKQILDTEEADRHDFSAHENVIRGNTISDNGLSGIAGWNHGGTVIFGNVIERNNNLSFYTHYSLWPTNKDFNVWNEVFWEEWAAIKMHGSDALIEGNLIRDNEGHGIWYDNQYTNARVTRNCIVNNRMTGIFFELGGGPCLIDNNVVAFTRGCGLLDRPAGDYYAGHGIHAHDASGLMIVHNLFASNAGAGVLLRSQKSRTEEGASHERVLNNVFYDNAMADINLPPPSSIKGKDNVSDYNAIMPRVPGVLFQVNEFEKPISEQVVGELRQALEKAAVPANEWPNLASWPKYPILTMRQWQLLTGRDTHSVELPFPTEPRTPVPFLCYLRPRIPNLTLHVNPAFDACRAVELDLVTSDYLGDAIIPGKARPGPFQRLVLGPEPNIIQLWPARGEPSNGKRDMYRLSKLYNFKGDK